ncbi:MAG: hypothetical protein ISR79_02515 [Nitrosopumilus sp.]|nr:hypothetical protein [Nitrosopumilus sp.]
MNQITTGRTCQGCGGGCALSYPTDVKIYNRSYYDDGFRFCSGCRISIQINEIRCRCCKQQFRSKPRDRRNKKDNRPRI